MARFDCPVADCGYDAQTKAAVGAHMRTVHGMFGGLSGQARPDKRNGLQGAAAPARPRKTTRRNAKPRRRATKRAVIRATVVPEAPQTPSEAANGAGPILRIRDDFKVALDDQGAVYICQRVLP